MLFAQRGADDLERGAGMRHRLAQPPIRGHDVRQQVRRLSNPRMRLAEPLGPQRDRPGGGCLRLAVATQLRERLRLIQVRASHDAVFGAQRLFEGWYRLAKDRRGLFVAPELMQRDREVAACIERLGMLGSQDLAASVVHGPKFLLRRLYLPLHRENRRIVVPLDQDVGVILAQGFGQCRDRQLEQRLGLGQSALLHQRCRQVVAGPSELQRADVRSLEQRDCLTRDAFSLDVLARSAEDGRERHVHACAFAVGPGRMEGETSVRGQSLFGLPQAHSNDEQQQVGGLMHAAPVLVLDRECERRFEQ